MVRLSNKSRDWEFWLEAFVTNSGRILGKPFKWDGDKNRLAFLQPCWKYRCGLFMLTCDCIYQMFVAVTLNYSETSLGNIMRFLTHAISRIACCVVELNLIPTKMAADHFNETLGTHRQLKKQHEKSVHYKVGTNSIRRYYFFLAILSVAQPLFGPIPQFLNERHNFRYWGFQYLPRHVYDAPPVIFLFVLLELLMSNVASTTCAYTAIILHLYTFLTGSWIDFFRNNLRYEIQKHKSRTLGGNKSIPINMIKTVNANLTGYRLLAIQSRLHNASFAPFLWPVFQYALLAVHCLLNFTLIRCQNLDLPLYFNVMIAFVLLAFIFFEKNCFQTAANIYASSVKYSSELGKLQNKLFHKIRVSLRPIRIEVGSCYYFKTSTFISFERSLVDYTISALLTISVK